MPRALAQEIRRAMKRYPQKRSAAMPALWAVQRRYGWCSPEGINQAAAVMGVTPGYLEGVATFYDLFHLEPQGEHQVLVCTNISCWLRGADRLLEAFKEARDRVAKPNAPSPGTPGREAEDVPDDVFIQGFECMGACDIAPMASIDERYYGPLDENDAEDAVNQLRAARTFCPRSGSRTAAPRAGREGPATSGSRAILSTGGHGPSRGRADAAAEGRGDPPAVPEHRRAGPGLHQDLPRSSAATSRSGRPTRR